MATSAVARSPPRSGDPDRRSKEIPPPLSLTVESPPASSPFPSPSSSFVPPPMPGAHEFANKPVTGRYVRRKKSSNGFDESALAGKRDEDGNGRQTQIKTADSPRLIQSTESDIKQPQASDSALKQSHTNGSAPALDLRVRNITLNTDPSPNTPTPGSTSITPIATTSHTSSHSPSERIPEMEADADAPPQCGRNTPKQNQITLPPPPSPSQIFSSSTVPTLIGTPSGSRSKHTSLSSSRPAPASPSPVPSRRQSLRSRHLSAASTSSVLKTHSLSATPPRRKGEIKVRDFGFSALDARHQGRGPDVPKVIRKLLKHHGPILDRRASGMSESSVDSEEGSSRRSSGFGSWGAFRWASKLSGWGGFGGRSSPSGSGGYTPSQQDFERNFDDTDTGDAEAEADADTGEYSSDYDDPEGEGESEELLPGLYRALYDFEPEGTAEMGLKENQMVKVIGRGGGVGWAVAVRPDVNATPEEGVESTWALVPESYLKLVKLDEEEGEGE